MQKETAALLHELARHGWSAQARALYNAIDADQRVVAKDALLKQRVPEMSAVAIQRTAA